MPFLTRHWFLIALLIVLVVAGLGPALPTGDWLTTVKLLLVAAIFLISGMAIRTSELLRGLGHWRLHLSVQGLSLLIAPLICAALDPLWAALGMPPALRLGLLVLGALPTTVTSCVALTAAAGGNQAGALVNATLGNLLAIAVTPAWIILLAGGLAVDLELGPVLRKLSLAVLLPIVVGQMLQFILSARLTPALRSRLGKSSLGFLLLIVYLSFAATKGGATPTSWGLIIAGSAIVIGLHGLWLLLPALIGRWPALRLDQADRSCLLLCSSQKTFALGLPLIALCFPGHPDIALIVLPILVYHPLQLIIAAPLVAHLAAHASDSASRQRSGGQDPPVQTYAPKR